jgi:hypothetical protein
VASTSRCSAGSRPWGAQVQDAASSTAAVMGAAAVARVGRRHIGDRDIHPLRGFCRVRAVGTLGGGGEHRALSARCAAGVGPSSVERSDLIRARIVQAVEVVSENVQDALGGSVKIAVPPDAAQSAQCATEGLRLFGAEHEVIRPGEARATRLRAPPTRRAARVERPLRTSSFRIETKAR